MRTIQRAYKTELKPTPEQAIRFMQFAGSCRFVYNWGLARKQEAHEQRKVIVARELARMEREDGATEVEKIIEARKKAAKKVAYSAVAMPGAQSGNNQALTVLKRTEEYLWLYETANECLQNALRNLDNAYAHFYRRWSEGKRGKALGFPRYKTKKKGLGGFRFNKNGVRVFSDQIKLPVIGLVQLKEENYLPQAGCSINSATVTEQAGRWFISLQVVEALPEPAPRDAVVGIDLGCNHLATLSDGTVFENPKPLKRNLRKLKRAQRVLSRRQKGSANRQKARRRVARIYQRIGFIRQNALHQTTTAIVKRYGVVVMEDLNVAGMVKNRRLARTISDVGLYEFKRQMAYKLDWAGGTLVFADRFYPSSKNCSRCGAYKGTLTLADRVYRCDVCGLVLDRDLNAARNLVSLVAGKPLETLNACGEYVRPNFGSATLVEARTCADVGLGHVGPSFGSTTLVDSVVLDVRSDAP